VINATEPKTYSIHRDLCGWAVCRNDRIVWVAQTRAAARQAVEEYKAEDAAVAAWYAARAAKRAKV